MLSLGCVIYVKFSAILKRWLLWTYGRGDTFGMWCVFLVNAKWSLIIWLWFRFLRFVTNYFCGYHIIDFCGLNAGLSPYNEHFANHNCGLVELSFWKISLAVLVILLFYKLEFRASFYNIDAIIPLNFNQNLHNVLSCKWSQNTV